jgi:predicted double-glycine peptidase
MRLPCGILLIASFGAFDVSSQEGRPAVWLDVPFVRQEKNGCGAASISMVMRYWSRAADFPLPGSADPSVIMQRLFSKNAKGIFASGMQRYFNEEGYQTFVFGGEWIDLGQHLSRGRPLIVCLKENGKESLLHYAVVTGLDPQQDSVLLNDPARRKLLRMDRASFERCWHAADNWTLLAVPQERR